MQISTWRKKLVADWKWAATLLFNRDSSSFPLCSEFSREALHIPSECLITRPNRFPLTKSLLAFWIIYESRIHRYNIVLKVKRYNVAFCTVSCLIYYFSPFQDFMVSYDPWECGEMLKKKYSFTVTNVFLTIFCRRFYWFPEKVVFIRLLLVTHLVANRRFLALNSGNTEN